MTQEPTSSNQVSHSSSSGCLTLLCCLWLLMIFGFFGAAGSHHGGSHSSSTPIYIGGGSGNEDKVDPIQLAKTIEANKILVAKTKEVGWKTLVSENPDDPDDPYVIMVIEKKGLDSVWPIIAMVEEPQIKAIGNGAQIGVTKDFDSASGTVMIRNGKIHHIEITFFPKDSLATTPLHLTYLRATVSGDMDEYAEVVGLEKWSEVKRVSDNTLVRSISFRGINPADNDIAQFDVVSNDKNVLAAFGAI